MPRLIVGASGLLGSDFVSCLTNQNLGFSSLSGHHVEVGNSLDSLLENIASLGFNPDHIGNFSGYTEVDKAEAENHKANLVNADYPEKLASVAKKLNATFTHISTDYVFDGNSTSPYKISDTPNPQSAYGRSKLAGEIAVQESGADYQIFRTAWLYGANGNCFPKTVARVLKEQGQIKVVNDQVGQPTWAKDLAELIIVHQDLDASLRPRIVHATASGSCSWYEFAREIALSLGYDPDQVVIPITTAEYPTPAKRPAYSVLDNQNESGLVIGDWRDRWKEAAPLVLAEYLK